MLIIPALDLRGGKCARLLQGNYSREITYPFNPVEIALTWQKKGAKWLHLVDLDGAYQGELVHWDVIAEILKKVNMKIQIGGGVSKDWIAQRLFDIGVKRIVVSSIAFSKPEIFSSWKERYKDKIIVSLDVRGNQVKIKGWQENSLNLEQALNYLKSLEINKIIFTSIEQDGTLKGVDLEKIKQIISYGFQLIVAGGVKDENDLENLRRVKGVEGVIIGRALLEGRINIPLEGV